MAFVILLSWSQLSLLLFDKRKRNLPSKLNGTSYPQLKMNGLSEAESQSGENYAMKIIYT